MSVYPTCVNSRKVLRAWDCDTCFREFLPLDYGPETYGLDHGHRIQQCIRRREVYVTAKMLQMQLEGCGISFIVWDIFKTILRMKVHKVERNLNLQKRKRVETWIMYNLLHFGLKIGRWCEPATQWRWRWRSSNWAIVSNKQLQMYSSQPPLGYICIAMGGGGALNYKGVWRCAVCGPEDPLFHPSRKSQGSHFKQ